MNIVHNCECFMEGIDSAAPEYRRFKRVMDRRNWYIHGNVDPVGERLEEVYFDDLIPLYKRPGDVVADFFGGVRQYLKPEEALRGYEDVHEFIGYVMDKVHPGYRERLRTFLAAQYPGFEVNHNRVGQLFGDYMTSIFWPGLSYDDDLKLE